MDCMACNGTGKIEAEHKLEVGQMVNRAAYPYHLKLTKSFMHIGGPAWCWESELQHHGPNWDFERALTPVKSRM